MLRSFGLNRLFWKIFLAFWLVLIAIATSTAFITDQIIHLDYSSPLRQQILGYDAQQIPPHEGLRPNSHSPHIEHLHLPPRRGFRRSPVVRWTFISVSIIVTGLMSYFLSAYLVNPIRQVRDATRKLSQGDLSVRVSSSISPRKDELGELGKDFDLMAERLDALISSQKRMLRDVSHELRTPLARLHVALELARAKSENAAKNELDRIEYETDKLNHLIGQIIELVRIEQRESELSRKKSNLTQLLAHIVEDADFEASRQNKKVSLRATKEFMVRINKELISSALENVIRNATTHTPENTIVEVVIKQSDPNTVQVIISDQGRGVSKEDLSHLFEPFYKVNSNHNQSSGYGVGLAIAERAIKLHDGEILAQNQTNGGLMVTIHLPSLE